MTDRELLELAAKAAGLVVKRARLDDPMNKDILVAAEPDGFEGWNPLLDDGDALRLAVKLRLDICRPHEMHDGVCVWLDHKGEFIEEAEGDDAYAATRRAITRAAAEIGKAMP